MSSSHYPENSGDLMYPHILRSSLYTFDWWDCCSPNYCWVYCTLHTHPHTHTTHSFLFTNQPVAHKVHIPSQSLYALMCLAFSFDVPQITGSCTWNIHEQPQAAIWLTRNTIFFSFFYDPIFFKILKMHLRLISNDRILIKVSSLHGNDLGSAVCCHWFHEKCIFWQI